jgi:hypothetical protein
MILMNFCGIAWCAIRFHKTSLSKLSKAFSKLRNKELFHSNDLLAIDYIMRESTEGKRNGIQWTMWQQLEDLDFADDIALISSTQQQMQEK